MDSTWQKETETYDSKVLDYFYKNLEEIRTKIVIAAEISADNEAVESEPALVIEKTFDANIETINTYLSELTIPSSLGQKRETN